MEEVRYFNIEFDLKYSAENRERILNLLESYQESLEITNLAYDLGEAHDKLNLIKNQYGSKKEICLDENCKHHNHEKKSGIEESDELTQEKLEENILIIISDIFNSTIENKTSKEMVDQYSHIVKNRNNLLESKEGMCLFIKIFYDTTNKAFEVSLVNLRIFVKNFLKMKIFAYS